MTAIHCDICQAPMTMTGEPGVHVSFKCTKCDQHFGVSNGGISCTILRVLWPFKMDENSVMFRDDYLPDWLRKRQQDAQLMLCAGLWDETEAAKAIATARKTYDDWFLTHPVKRPWWRFWRKT